MLIVFSSLADPLILGYPYAARPQATGKSKCIPVRPPMRVNMLLHDNMELRSNNLYLCTLCGAHVHKARYTFQGL